MSWLLSYFALPEQGIELIIELARDEPVTFVISDITHGLPELPGNVSASTSRHDAGPHRADGYHGGEQDIPIVQRWA